jgi:hypothetical protein
MSLQGALVILSPSLLLPALLHCLLRHVQRSCMFGRTELSVVPTTIANSTEFVVGHFDHLVSTPRINGLSIGSTSCAALLVNCAIQPKRAGQLQYTARRLLRPQFPRSWASPFRRGNGACRGGHGQQRGQKNYASPLKVKRSGLFCRRIRVMLLGHVPSPKWGINLSCVRGLLQHRVLPISAA